MFANSSGLVRALTLAPMSLRQDNAEVVHMTMRPEIENGIA
jgi:hypothetical protein